MINIELLKIKFEMQLRLFTLLIAAGFSILGFSSGFSNKDGIAGRVGSPLENTCQPSCHNSHPVNSGSGSLVITSPDLINFVYNPGQTYTVEVTVAKPSVNLFGFAMEALFQNGSDAGSFIHINPAETWSKAANINGAIRTSATHMENAGASANTKTFVFQWVAPATNAGAVTFYAAGNAANGNGSTSGDYIYTAMQLVNDSATAASDGSLNEQLTGINIFPNPVGEQLFISHRATKPGPLKIETFSIDGKFEMKLLMCDELPGLHLYQFPANCFDKKGLYLIKISKNNKVAIRKVIIS